MAYRAAAGRRQARAGVAVCTPRTLRHRYMRLARNPYDHFVEIPAITRSRTAPPQLSGDPGPELQNPAPHRLNALRSHPSLTKFRDCPQCPEMVVIPAGSFMMGASQSEVDRYAFPSHMSLSLHPVRITRQFALGEFLLTRKQYATFVEETGHGGSGCAATTPDTSLLKFDVARSWRRTTYRCRAQKLQKRRCRAGSAHPPISLEPDTKAGHDAQLIVGNAAQVGARAASDNRRMQQHVAVIAVSDHIEIGIPARPG